MANDAKLVYSGTELEVMAAAVNYHRWIVDRFTPYLGRRVAEVGAGIGSVSQQLLERKIDRLLAFEPSQNMFPFLRQALDGEPRARAINDFFCPSHADEELDSIVYINVMEHIENDAEELAKAFAALGWGGHVLVFVPALPWLYSEFDRELGHFRRYTRRSLANLARDAGFTVRDVRYFDAAGILPWYVAFKLLKLRPRAGNVTLYDRLVVPPMRLVESAFAPPLGKNVLLVARKGGNPIPPADAAQE